MALLLQVFGHKPKREVKVKGSPELLKFILPNFTAIHPTVVELLLVWLKPHCCYGGFPVDTMHWWYA